MLIIRIFLMTALFQNLPAMEEPLPDWLKVYQQNNFKPPVEKVESVSDIESEFNTLDSTSSDLDQEKSGSKN